MKTPRSRLRALLGMLLVGASVVGIGPISPAAPAGADCAARNQTMSGSFTGSDGMTISGFVGLTLLDANQNPIGLDGCYSSVGAYPVYDCINANVTSSGCYFTRDVNGGGSGNERSWSISGLPSNAYWAVVEAYPKSSTGDPSGLYSGWTDFRRYGGAMRWRARVGGGADIALPLRCSAGGTTGGISATATIDGRPADVYYTVAFSRSDETQVPIVGFMPSNEARLGSFDIPALVAGQRYSIEINLRDGRRFWYEHDYGYGVPVNSCATTRRSFALQAQGGVPGAHGYAIDVSGPTAGPGAADMAGQRNVFYRGGDGGLYQVADNGAPTPTSLGGGISGTPDATSWGNGRTDVVVRGNDGQVWWNYYDSRNGRWSGFLALGGGTNFSPAITSWGNGRLDVVITGLDGQLWHRWTGNANQSTASWSGWQPLGGRLSAAPDVTTWGPNRLDIVGRGIDSAVWHLYWANGWSPWEYLGGSIAGGPTASSPAVNRLDIGAFAGGNRIYTMRWNGSSYTGWGWLNGGNTDMEPDMTSSGGRTTIYLRGTDGVLYRSTRATPDGGFSGWAPLSI